MANKEKFMSNELTEKNGTPEQDIKPVSDMQQIQTESVYTLEELSGSARQLFGVREECIVAALKAVNITECTVSKAKEIIENFISKEVK